MRTHAGNADVAIWGCGALWNIAAVPAGKFAVNAAGGRETVEAAVACHAAAKKYGAAALNAQALK